MTSPDRAAFRGEVEAAAFVLDPVVAGEHVARARVLARWTAGTRLLRWPDGRWLLLLATPETVRADQAIGLPLVARAGGLATPGEPGVPGVVRVPSGGQVTGHRVDDLPAVDVSTWLAPGGVRPVRLAVVEAPPEPVRPDPLPMSPEPDLRALAGVGRSPRRTSAAGSARGVSAGRLGRRGGVVLLVLLGVAALAVVSVFLLARAGPDRTTRRLPSSASVAAPSPTATPSATPTVTVGPSGQIVLPDGPTVTAPTAPGGSAVASLGPVIAVAIGLAFGAAVRGRRGAGRRGAGGKPRPGARGRRSARTTTVGAPRSRRPRARRLRDAAVRLVLGSPAGGVVGRRHARYLQRLDEDFARGRWDDALAAAVGLGDGAGLLTLRLPDRRSSLSLLQPGGVSGAVPWGGAVHQHLRALYVDAAARLERAGDTERAAFVLAVLLRDVPGAVALLERTGHARLAAQLAESRGLPAEVVVRLWWRAGERGRAVDLARARGVFAATVARLEEIDASLAHDLRRAWVETARAAGDAVTAVEAAWSDPALRREAVADIRAGLAVGGPEAGHLLARFVSGGWATDQLSLAVPDLLTAPTPEQGRLRTGFLVTFAEGPAPDPRLDRRWSSAAVLAIARDPVSLAGVPRARATTTVAALRRRADPLLAADLPPWQHPARPETPATVELTGPGGLRPIVDAVVLPDTSVLVALGEGGVHWLTPTGAVRARWSVPAHRLVLADHGRAAVLLRGVGEQVEVHRIDLTDRSGRYRTTLRVQAVASSFDGAALVTVDEDGIAVVDTLGPRPRVIWRELSAAQPVVALGRTPSRLTAVAWVERATALRTAGHGPPQLELFGWDLPSMTLRVRRRFDVAAGLREVLPTGWRAALRGTSTSGAEGLLHVDASRPTRFEALARDARTVTVADTIGTVDAGGGGFSACFSLDDGPQLRVRGTASPADIGVQRHGDTLTVHDGPGGRIVGVDVTTGDVVSRIRILG